MADADQAVRDIVKGASVVYVGLFAELLIAFLAQILAARYLSVSDFGGLTTGTALLDVGSIVAGLGFGSGLTRYLPRIDEEEKRTLVATVLLLTGVISFSIGAIITLNASFIAGKILGDTSVAASIRIFGAAIPFAALLNIAVGGIRGQKESLPRVYIKNLAHPLARISLVIIAITFGLGQAGMAGAYAIPYVVSAILALILLFRSLSGWELSINTDLTAEVARYSIPFTITGVAGFVYRSIDIFLILHFLGSFAVGVYGVAYAATSFMGMLSTAFNFIGSPVASELEHGGNVNGVMDVFQSVVRWLVIGSVCILIPLGVFSTEFISIIYQSKYESGGVVLTVLATGFAVKNVLSVHSPILQALGRSKILSYNSIAAAIANLFLNILLIPKYGIMGAATATVIAFFLRDLLAVVEVRYYLGTMPISRESIGPTVVGTAYLGGITIFIAPEIPETFLWLLGVSGIFSVLYCGTVLLLFGLSKTEIMVLRSAEEKYGINLKPIDPLIRFLSNR